METRNRRANRLKAHDYSRAGGYFVTICAQGRINRFGDIVGGEMNMNEEGRIVAESWEWLGRQYDYVELDEWALMPNHLHGVLIIHDARAGGNIRRGGSRTAPTKPLPGRAGERQRRTTTGGCPYEGDGNKIIAGIEQWVC